MADIRLYNLCLIENPETRQVVALDKVSSPFAGITLPGDKVEKGESIAASVIREVREETGLSLGSWRFRGIVTFVSDEWGTEYMHLFTADSFTGASAIDVRFRRKFCWASLSSSSSKVIVSV